MDRCHIYSGVHIPGCMGCAARGHEYCTCPTPGDERDRKDVQRRLEALEERVATLEGRQAGLPGVGGTPRQNG